MNYLLSKEHFIAHEQLKEDYKNLVCHYEDFKLYRKATAESVFGLGEGGELESLLFVLAPKFDRSTKVQFTTEPPLLPNPCYAYVWRLFRTKLNLKTKQKK